MGSGVKTYDPKDYDLVIGGHKVGGFMDGSKISYERNSDSFATHSGTDGEVSRVALNDRTGRITIRLAQTSASNDVLSSYNQFDEATKKGIYPVMLKDRGGTTAVASGSGWVRKPAGGDLANSMSAREWVIDLASMKIHTGGNPTFGL